MRLNVDDQGTRENEAKIQQDKNKSRLIWLVMQFTSKYYTLQINRLLRNIMIIILGIINVRISVFADDFRQNCQQYERTNK
jgi:hypothetical protein